MPKHETLVMTDKKNNKRHENTLKLSAYNERKNCIYLQNNLAFRSALTAGILYKPSQLQLNWRRRNKETPLLFVIQF